MKFKILDTKWKKQRRLEIMLMILDVAPMDELKFEAIYDLVIRALNYEWIHPKY